MTFQKGCFFIFLVFLSLSCGGQIWQATSEHYTKDEGLPTNNINEIFQDQKGFIWLATGAGLCKFDGYHFKNYHIRHADPNIIFIEEDKNGTLWFATHQKKIYYLQGDSIIPYAYNELISGKKGYIHDFKYDAEKSQFYVAMGRSGLYLYGPKGLVDSYPHNKKYSKVIIQKPKFSISSFMAKEFTNDTLHWKDFTIEWYIDDKLKVIDISKDSTDGNVHIYCNPFGANGYILVLGKKLCYFENFILKWTIPLPVLKAKPYVDEDGSIFLALLEGNGMRKYVSLDDLQSNTYEQWVPNEGVTAFFIDQVGGYWVSTITNGFYYFPTPEIKYIDIPKLKSVVYVAPNTIYGGTGDGQILKLSQNKNSAKILPKLPFSSPVMDLVWDKQSLYAGTNYLQTYQEDRWNVSPYKNDRAIPCQFFSSFPKNRTLICHTGQNMTLVDKLTNKPVYYFSDSTILSYKEISKADRLLKVFAHTSDSTFWISTTGGLYDVILPDKKNQTKLTSKKIFDKPAEQLISSKAGYPVFSFNADLFILKDSKIYNITQLTGVSAGNILCIGEGKSDEFWVGTQTGLLQFTVGLKNYFTGRKYTVGLPDLQIFGIDYCPGTIWLATDKGIMQFPENIGLYPLITPACLDILVNNQPRFCSENLQLKFDENNVLIKLATLDYRLGDKAEYRFRLSKNDPWETNKSNELRFFALQDKTYSLEVQVKNEDDIWGPSLVKSFTIFPPFYKTWWFISLMVVLSLLTVAYIYWYNIQLIKKEAKYNEDIHRLERSALQAQMNPHFIFNCLNSIQNFILQNDKTKASHYLSAFAVLVRDTLNASTNNKISLEDEIRMLENYLHLEKLRFGEKFEYEINVSDDIVPYDMELPPLLIQPFVENAILHGMKNTKNNGKINVGFKVQGDTLVATVDDNGPGIFNTENISLIGNEKDPETPKYKSLGINITKSRLKYLQKGNEKESWAIVELKDEFGNVIGTRVQLFFQI